MRRFIQLASNHFASKAPLGGLFGVAAPPNLVISSSRNFAIIPIRFSQQSSGGNKKSGNKKGFFERMSESVSSNSKSQRKRTSSSNLSHSKPSDNCESKARRSTTATPTKRPVTARDKSQPQAKRSGSLRSGGGKGRDHRVRGAVKHDKNGRRFVLDLGNNQVARIDYKPVSGSHLLELYHTEVPEELRGRGIGRALAKGALECAAQEGTKIKVTCSYLIDYVKRYADERHKRVVIDK